MTFEKINGLIVAPFTPFDKKMWRNVVECGEKCITLASISTLIDKYACDL